MAGYLGKSFPVLPTNDKNDGIFELQAQDPQAQQTSSKSDNNNQSRVSDDPDPCLDSDCICQYRLGADIPSHVQVHNHHLTMAFPPKIFSTSCAGLKVLRSGWETAAKIDYLQTPPARLARLLLSRSVLTRRRLPLAPRFYLVSGIFPSCSWELVDTGWDGQMRSSLFRPIGSPQGGWGSRSGPSRPSGIACGTDP